jgi:serine/threonine-protein kinase
MVPGEVQRGPEIATTDSAVDPLDCSSAWAPGKSWPYVNSGKIAIARQVVSEQPTPNHGVVQAVVAFPDDIVARKSYNTQVKTWMDCQGKTLTSHLSGSTPDQTAVVGGASENGDVATLQTTPNLPGLTGVVCQRVLTPVGNVVVDVRACSPNVGDTGVTVARDIAAKITGG